VELYLGIENASTNVAENYQDNKQRCINGRLLIYVKKDAAENQVSLKLSSPLLETIELKIE
jgi:beta-galactosidase